MSPRHQDLRCSPLFWPSRRLGRLRHLATQWLVPGLAFVVVVAACGGSSGSSAPNKPAGVAPASSLNAGTSTATTIPKASTSTPSGSKQCEGNGLTVLCVKVDIAGSKPLKGSTKVTTVAESCAAFASNVTPRQKGTLTLPTLYDDVNGVPFNFGNLVEPYTGPGQYGLDKLKAPGSEFVLTVGEQTFTEATASTGSVTIEANGAGAFTFTNFASESSGDTVNGSVTWTCSQ